ncbi:enoyl-CoA hydratase/isomerase family protein [Candidatus Bathyarchaeota archaeon]|nr:enoyl-CoA hydratase/isomerase family protein [Candidatus Bathyarchaeota archaeon]
MAWITLNRPNVLNALNRKLWHELYKNLDKAEKDKETRAVVITGKGRAFSAGDDIEEVASLQTEDEIKSFFLDYATPTVTKIVQLSKPVIAAVNGLAYGGGCEIAMLCDLVVASESATFAVPEALIGAIPPIAATIGESLIGRLNASMMMLTGEPITAREAKLIGLVNQVVPLKDLETAAERLAKATMRAAPFSIRAIKRLSYKRFKKKDFKQAVAELIETIRRGEGKEGHRAFLEKRKPVWLDDAG